MPLPSLVLASGSPQRRRILERLGVPFTIRVSDVRELEQGADPRQVALENALRKACAAHRPGTRETVLGCDTIVSLDGVIYGKPPDARAARETLTALGGRTHEVLSGVALLLPDSRSGIEQRTAVACTRVTFRAMDEELLDWYVGTEEWRGRSGGYAIQGAGATLALAVDGEGERRRPAGRDAPRHLSRAARGLRPPVSSSAVRGHFVVAGSTKAPSRLAELLALGEAENGRGRDPIEEHFTRADRVAETKPRALGGCKVRPVLPLVGVGNKPELRCVADLDGASFDTTSRPSSPFWPVVRMHCGFCPRFFALRSSVPMQKYIASSCHTANRGVTCGRPSGRTVESQNTSASSMCRRPSAQSVGVASGLLNPAWSSPTGISAAMSSPLQRAVLGAVRRRRRLRGAPVPTVKLGVVLCVPRFAKPGLAQIPVGTDLAGHGP